MTRPKTQGIFLFTGVQLLEESAVPEERRIGVEIPDVGQYGITQIQLRQLVGSTDVFQLFQLPHLLAVEVGGFRRYTIRQHPKSMIDTAIEKFLQPIEFRFKFQAVHSLYDLIRL